ncbi:MAG TPA: aldehyde dehydrogenase family protein, partial [Clostridia bacterium]
MEKVKLFINNEFIESKTQKYMDVFNPSTGSVIAQAPCCTQEEIEMAVQAARKAFKQWSETPVLKRVQVLYRLRGLIESHLDELALLVATENGKVLEEAVGDVLKAKEATEQAISAPNLMMGESLMDTSIGYDSVLYREPVGVFAGIAPFNFPAMIPMGWMTPMCIACGNTIVLKASSVTPLTAMRFA